MNFIAIYGLFGPDCLRSYAYTLGTGIDGWCLATYVRKATSFSIRHGETSSLGSRMMIFLDERLSTLSGIWRDSQSKYGEKQQTTHGILGRIGHKPYVIIASFREQLYLPGLDLEPSSCLV